MAWIKIEHGTPDKPEVNIIAEFLRIDPDSVVGKLFRIWEWADRNSVDGNAVPVTDSFLDRLTQCKRFACAMRAAGWLAGENGALIFPRFARHNGETAKARAETNRRVTEHRKRKHKCNGNIVTDVTETPLQQPLPDKSKSKKETSSLTPLPPGGGNGLIETGVSLDVPGIVAIFPRRQGVAVACEVVAKWLAKGESSEAIIAGTKAHAAVIGELPGGALNRYVESAETFFRDRRWEDDPQARLRNGHHDGTGAPAGKPEMGGRKATVIKISPTKKL